MSDILDTSLANVWRSWWAFRIGKKPSRAIVEYEHYLEAELIDLHKSLNNGAYYHGSYKCMVVQDNKRREIAVANVRDRIVHRLLYDYLVPIFDKTFDYDVWSCRVGKGLTAAVNRTESLLWKHQSAFIWRADVTKFFDNMDHDVLRRVLGRKIDDQKALELLNKVIKSYSTSHSSKGIPIGNLTSQIFANIYLSQFDRYVRNQLKPLAYVRYGDDSLVFWPDIQTARLARQRAIVFLSDELGLTLHPRNDVIVKPQQGVHFLGVQIYPTGRCLVPRMSSKIAKHVTLRNFTGYYGLVKQHGSRKQQIELLRLPDDFMV